jgi:hypothetical protein
MASARKFELHEVIVFLNNAEKHTVLWPAFSANMGVHVVQYDVSSHNNIFLWL